MGLSDKNLICSILTLHPSFSSLEHVSSLSDGEWLLVAAFSFDVLIASEE